MAEYQERMCDHMSKIDKLINDTILYIQLLEYNIKKEELQNKYNNMVELYGEEKALQALKNTYNDMKNKSKEKEKEFWNVVKHEIFNKFKSCPCSTRE